MYVDEEALLVAWLPGALARTGPTPGVSVETPADPRGTYAWLASGFVRVRRVGGAGRYGIDSPRVVVESFAADYAAAKDLATRVRSAFEDDLPGTQGPDGVVLTCATNSGPIWAPYDDPRAFRFVATHVLTTHGQISH